MTTDVGLPKGDLDRGRASFIGVPITLFLCAVAKLPLAAKLPPPVKLPPVRFGWACGTEGGEEQGN